MTRVFVTNYAGHDYSKAEKYGPIIPITKGYVSFQSLDRVKFRIIETLIERGATEDDWLLYSGNSFISTVAGIIWFSRFKKVKILVHDTRNTGEYRESIITEKNINDIFSVLTADVQA